MVKSIFARVRKSVSTKKRFTLRRGWVEDFGLLLSNFRPDSIIVWLSAYTSLNRRMDKHIYTAVVTWPIGWKRIGTWQPFVECENGKIELLCIQPDYDEAAASVSIKVATPKRMTDTEDENTRSCIYYYDIYCVYLILIICIYIYISTF